MDLEMRPLPVTARPSEAGFSLIEALIAAAILLIISIGMIPMFTQSILNNAAGSDQMQGSVFAKDDLETLQDSAFASTNLLIPGASVESLTTDYFMAGTTAQGDESWATTAPTTAAARWNRTTRVTQYSIGAFDDGFLLDTERRPGNTQATQIHFKVIEVRLDSGKKSKSGLPPGPSLVYRILKPF
jgi:Tfp pilus assembly protein PilV